MCAGGEKDELETFKRLLEQYPAGIISIVSDTWDYWDVITNKAKILRDIIMDRQEDAFGNAKLTFRPDSGDPVKIICGDPSAPLDSPQRKGSVQVLWEIFGGTTNEKGYKTLDKHVGLIYGDSITPERCSNILYFLELQGFASDNVVFGIGSYTYQYQTRDTLGFAMKATNVIINGVDTPIYKNPKTDDGTKRSAKGRIQVVHNANGEYAYRDCVTKEEEENSFLQPVWRNGRFLVIEEFSTIRERLQGAQ